MGRFKIIPIVIALIVVGGGFFAYKRFYKSDSKSSPAALSINSFFGEANVFINDEPLGSTPLFREDLESGQVNLTLKGDNNIYEARVTLSPDTLTVVNRDLGVPGGFSAGEIIWLERSNFGSSLSIISDPSGADVLVDGTEVGTTPFSTTSLSASDHELVIKKGGFESRSVKVRLQDGYKLNVSTQLFPRPIPSEIKTIESPSEGITVYDLSIDDGPLTVESKILAKAISYFMKTRGENAVSFDYFVDSNGNLFDPGGVRILEESNLSGGEYTVGYLGGTQGKKLTDKAAGKIVELASGAVSGSDGDKGVDDGKAAAKVKVEILPTGTGWLRVRSGPGLSNEEVTKINVGEKFDLLDEESGWSRIKLSDGKEGWVSSQYLKKLE